MPQAVGSGHEVTAAAARTPRPARRGSIVAVAPMVVPALAMAAGVAADRHAIGLGVVGWGVVLVVSAAALVAGAWRRRGLWTAIAAAWFGLGGACHHRAWTGVDADDLARRLQTVAPPGPAWLRGVLVETPVYRPDPERPGGNGSTRTVVDVTAVSDGERWTTASGRVAVRIGGDRTDLEPGRAVEMAGTLAPIDGPRNPGERDPRDAWRAEGVSLRLAVDSGAGVWPDPDGVTWPLAYGIGRVRAWSHRRLVDGLAPEVAPLAAALLLGRREAVDPALNDAFARTGTTHLLAISGLHLQALAFLILVVARVLPIRRRTGLRAVIVGTTAYALLVGLAPSVVRSLAMTVVACVAGLIDRPVPKANLLAIALVATLLLDPTDLFDVGCQLSFLAVAVILWGVPALLARLRAEPDPLDRLERRYESPARRAVRSAGRTLVEATAVSALVWLAAAPLMALRFHLTAPIGVLLNLPLVPITSLALLAAGLSLGLSALWVPLGLPAAWTCRALLGWTDALVRQGAALPGGHAFGPGPPEGLTLAFYATLALAAAASLNRTPRGLRIGAWLTFAALAVAVVSVPRIGPPARPPEAEVFAVGHGLAVLVRSGDGRALLYDAGSMADPRVGRRLIAPALWARGVARLDAVALSHADSDHYNGLPDLLDRFPIGVVLTPPDFAGPDNPGASALLERVRGRGIPIRAVASGDSFRLGDDLRLTVHHPGEAPRAGASDNARSLVLAVESAGRTLLLTGDLEGPGLADLAARPAPTIDAFLAPHHGGRASNPAWLYDWARPALVVSSQKPPIPGTRDALAPVEARPVPVLRTHARGAVRLRWTQAGLAADGFLDAPAPLPGTPQPTPGGRPRMTASLATPPLIAAIGLLAGGLAAAVLAVVEWGAWILVSPGRPLALPADDPYPGESISVLTPDGLRLAGTWHPHTDADGRTLLLLHGLAEQRQTMRARADGIHSFGWNVAVLDSRAYGDSGGSHASFGGREVSDLRLWIDAISARVGPSPRLSVWGRSMGAGVALRTAAEDARIRSLVLEAPYIDLSQTAATLIRRYRLPASKPLAALILRRARRLAGVPLHRPRPIDVAPLVGVPVLILRGTADALVSDAETALLAEALAGPVERIEVPGARHSKVLDVGGPALIEKVGAFLRRASHPTATA